MSTYPLYYIINEKHTATVANDEEHTRAKDMFAQWPELDVRPATEEDPIIARVLELRAAQ